MTRELVAEDIGAETRRREVSALRGVPGAEVVEKLVEALGDVDWRVRKEAVQVGAAHPERISLIPRLVDLVANTDNVGQRNASLELFGLLGEVALEALVDSMNHVPANSRKFVVAAIGEAGRHEDVLVLERMLTDDDPNVAAAALEAIGRIGGPDQLGGIE
ncbi:MAG: HEAT repeat domain-containing protein, partial [Myxococcales bacterium]|nr:HEAT repeat domain-containing protein [Myxococcales bacterium]